jgi:hypothetical protein
MLRGILKYVFILPLTLAGSVLVAQSKISDSLASVKKVVLKVPKIPPITKQFALGYSLNTDGWSINFHKQKIKEDSEPQRQTGFIVEFAEKKNVNERKEVSSINLGNSDDLRLKYVYGKINNFYQFKTAYRLTFNLGERIEEKNIPIQLFADFGLSLGLLKPYYLKILRGSSAVVLDERYTEASKAIWTDRNFIGGASGFKKGVNEIQVIPGALLRSGAQFEYCPDKYYGLIFETGAELNAFTNAPTILVNGADRGLKASLFAGIKLVSKK